MARIRVVDDAKLEDEHITGIYLRVTAEESVKADLSLPNQRQRALEICSERGWSPAKVYQEPKHVGGDEPPAKRPALAALLADIEAGRVKRVLVRHDDRLWRSTEVQDTIIKVLRQHSVDLWTFAGQRELRSAGGRFALKVLGAAAELEKGLTGERIREMKRGKAHSGRLAGGPPAFGYTSQSRHRLELRKQGSGEDEAHRAACERYPVAKTWYIDDGEAEVVRLIFGLYLDERIGSRRISVELNRRGFRRRGGYAWSPVKVGKIVNNPAVAGLTSYDEEAYKKGLPSRAPRWRQTFYPGQHPAIISPERWQEAQRLKVEVNAKNVRTKGSPTARVYPLTGVLRCGVCGSSMSGKSTGTRRPGYYVCSRRKYYGPIDGCAGPTIHMRWAVKTLWRYLDDLFESPDMVKEVMERLNRKLADEAPEFGARLREVEAQTRELEAKQSRWMEKYEATTDEASAEIIWTRVRELKAQELVLRREAEELSQKLAPRSEKALTLEETAAYLAKLNALPEAPAARRRIFVEKLRHRHDLRVRVLGPKRLMVTLCMNEEAMREQAKGAPLSVGQRLAICGKAPTSAKTWPMSPGKPDPGGPTKTMLWPPAAAISSARRATSCPRTSDKSAPVDGTNGGHVARGAASISPRRASTSSAK
jgi:site-specific DNA recombinase